MKLSAADIKEKMILVGITAAIFLPARLLVNEYLFDHWIGNLGFATLISTALIVLVKKEKLGRLGRIFKNQIVKTLWSRSVKIIVCVLVLFMAYFGTTILLVDRGNTIYYEDKVILSESIASRNVDQDAFLKLNGPQVGDADFGLAQIQYFEYIFSISYAILNDATHGWLVSLHLIMFMEQIEVLWLLWFFRRYLKPVISN